MTPMVQPTILLTSPSTGVKTANPSYPATLENLLDTRQADRLTAERAYVVSGWFRRCVEIRADALASIPYTIRSGGRVLYDSAGFAEIPEDLMWLAELDTLLKLTESSLTVMGAAYWMPKIRGGRPVSIDWLAPHLVQPQYDATGNIVAYKRRLYVPDGGMYAPKETTIAARWVVPFFAKDIFTEVGPGNAVGDAARVNADVLYSLDEFLDSYMDRGLLPATILSVPANTPPEERNRFQQWWDKYYRGKNRAGTQKVLNADSVKVEKIGDGIGQLGASEIVQQQREAIAAIMGVPKSHLLPEAGKQSYQDDENLYVKTVIPEAKRIAAVLNQKLFSDYGLYFRFEYKRIEALQRANLETARGVQRLVEKPVLTQNEGRGIIGYEASDEEGADSLIPDRSTDLSNEASSLAVMEASADPDARRSLSPEMGAEIANWRKKAEKRGLDVSFNCEAIPPMVEGEIRRRIKAGLPLEVVFEEPFYDY